MYSTNFIKILSAKTATSKGPAEIQNQIYNFHSVSYIKKKKKKKNSSQETVHYCIHSEAFNTLECQLYVKSFKNQIWFKLDWDHDQNYF